MVGAAPVRRFALPVADADCVDEMGCGSALASCCLGGAGAGLAAATTGCGSDFGLAATTVAVCFGAAAGFDFGVPTAGAGWAGLGSSLAPDRLPKNSPIRLEPTSEATCT